jgi:hypothetical protein
MRLLFLSPFPARELRRPSALRRPRLLAAFAAAALVAVAVTPPTVEAQTGDDPIELWKAYPLDPTRRDRDEQSTSARGTPTVPRPPAATTPGAPPRPTADEDGRPHRCATRCESGRARVPHRPRRHHRDRPRSRLASPAGPDLRKAAVVRGGLPFGRSVSARARASARWLATAEATPRLLRLPLEDAAAAPAPRPYRAPPTEAAPSTDAARRASSIRPAHRRAGARMSAEECTIEW